MNLRFLKLWKNWDDDEKASAITITGLLVAAFAVFILISTVSYLFHWREDMGCAVEVANAAGNYGNSFGKFMVADLLGLGSFGFLVILFAISIRLLLGRWRHSLIKTTLVVLLGSFLCSTALAYAGHFLNLQNAFGGGLGGRCGELCISWAETNLGVSFTGILIAVLALCWVIFSFGNIFQRKEKPIAVEEEVAEEPEPEEVGVEEEQEQEEDTPTVEPAFEPVFEPEPIPQTAEPELLFGNDTGLSTDNVKPLKDIDNRLDPPDGLPNFVFPPSLNILSGHEEGRKEVTKEEVLNNNTRIRSALADYRIQVADVQALVGPTVTLYKVYPAAGVKIADIKKLQEDIAMSLNAKGVRVVNLPDSVGIEVANKYQSVVPLKAMLNDDSFRNTKASLPVAIGYTITRQVKVFDLAEAPHLLIAGATQQGKSVGLNVIVSSLLYAKHPSELKFVFIDPKMVEFSAYGKLLHHYLAVLPENNEKDVLRNAIVKTPKNAERVLSSLCIEMDERYKLLEKAGVNKLSLYNEKYKARHLLPTEGHRYLPYLVVVVDEYADLTMMVGSSAESKNSGRSITNSIIRLAQKGRAAGIHVILATQRPSVNVISGLIKSNFPMRIAFRVAAKVDSQTILDSPGAERLIGKGDMLFSAGIESERIQCAYVSGDEINSITSFIENQEGFGKSYNNPYFLPSPDENSDSENGSIDMSKIDERFEDAARVVVMLQKGSTSALQTKLGMGFSKAARVMDQLEAAGIVGPSLSGGKPREVLVSNLEDLEQILSEYR